MKTRKNFFRVLFTFIAILLPWLIAVILINNPDEEEYSKAEYFKEISYTIDTIQKVDHSKFEILKQNFERPQDVTNACLSCHNRADHDIMMTSHWNWSRKTISENGDTIELGKKNILNNFCVGTSSNEARCTSCHIGYGWKDKNFDFTKSENIDCLVCHDQTGSYKKFPSSAGYPVKEEKKFDGTTFSPPDYNLIAQNVGVSKKENCGACHFNGGGGNNVKHGDIAMELNHITDDIDVHMAVDGKDMSCTACHVTEHHNITGQLYSVSSENEDRVTCTQCHTEAPHRNEHLNLHNNKVACQTCHIPFYAKVNATKMSWDWSTAGKLNADGSQIVLKDSAGNITYHTKKGNFNWETNVEPEYAWSNGKAKHYMLGEKVDTTEVIKLNTLLGEYNDPDAIIIPVKVHRARQIYDPANKILINPHLFGKDSTSYWKNFDWDKASRTGMESANLPYSGEYTFVSTEMSWPINHMVSKSSEALTCTECHSPQGRLKDLDDFYMVGRDSSSTLDIIGILMIIGALGGVTVHAAIRIFNGKKRKKAKG
ncbi:MAG: tetrathionate reductase family octaheme c-type cytochrome [Bacteroidota bacterium]